MLEDAGEQWDWALIRRRCEVEALRMLRRRDDAEEVVQEALTRAWRSRGSCRTPEAPLSWCLQITRNEALRVIGRPRRADHAELNDEIVDLRTLGEGNATLERLDLGRALEELRPDERLLISLGCEQDCSHPEIAAKLKIHETTARVRLHRAHKRLRSLLEDPA